MVLAGAKVRASDIRTVQSKSKAATESVTSSTTLQDDDDLFMDLEAGKSYRVWLILTVASGGAEAADIKTSWTFAGTATKVGRCVWGLGISSTATDDSAFSKSSGVAIGASVSYGIDAGQAAACYESLILEDVTVAGRLQLQWAQVASNATATVLSTTSRVFWEEIDVN